MMPRQQQQPLTGPGKPPQPPLQATAHGVGTHATMREWQCCHQTKWNDEMAGDTGGGNKKEAKHMNNRP